MAQLLEATFNATPLLIAHLDLEFRFRAVNAAYAAADQKPAEYFVGKAHFALFPNPENEAIFARVRDTGLAHTSRARAFAYEYNPERGVSYWDWTLTPVKGQHGAVTGLVLTLSDVTERVRALQALALKEEHLAAELAEKETLLREVHHRVKNNLQVVCSLLSLQAANSSAPEVKSALADSENRLLAMARVHEQLYRSARFSSLELSTHLCELARMVFRTTHKPGVEFRCDVEPVEADLEVALPLGLVVTELVANACRHAFEGRSAGTVELRVRRAGEGLVLEVADDGRGLPAGFDLQTTSTLGLRLVNTLARQLRGTVSLRREGGAVLRLEVPEVRVGGAVTSPGHDVSGVHT